MHTRDMHARLLEHPSPQNGHGAAAKVLAAVAALPVFLFKAPGLTVKQGRTRRILDRL